MIGALRVNLELFIYGNWNDMHLKTAYKWCYTFICTRQDGPSNSAVSSHCVLVSRQSLISCQCRITSTTVICCQSVSAFNVSLSVLTSASECVTVIYISSVLFIFLCVQLILLHFICVSAAVAASQHKSQFSQSHSQQQKISMKQKFPWWDSNLYPLFGSPMDCS